MNRSEELRKDYERFLKYLKTKVPLFHMSNVFLRDIQYGIIEYFEQQKIKVKYSEAEKLASDLTDFLEEKGILRNLDHQTWVLIHPEFTAKAS